MLSCTPTLCCTAQHASSHGLLAQGVTLEQVPFKTLCALKICKVEHGSLFNFTNLYFRMILKLDADRHRFAEDAREGRSSVLHFYSK